MGLLQNLTCRENMEEYGRDWCFCGYTMMAGVLANFSPNSWTILILPIWPTFPWCSTDGFHFSICCNCLDSTEDNNEPLGSGRPL